MATNLLKDFRKKPIKTARFVTPIEAAGLQKYLETRFVLFDKELAESRYSYSASIQGDIHGIN